MGSSLDHAATPTALSITCACAGNEAATAVATLTIQVITGGSFDDGRYEFRPPKPSRLDRVFFDELSRLKLRRDRRRFKRF